MLRTNIGTHMGMERSSDVFMEADDADRSAPKPFF